jgi:hypothetical protein
MRSWATAGAIALVLLGFWAEPCWSAPKKPKPQATPGKLTLVHAPTEPATITFVGSTRTARLGALTLFVNSPVRGKLKLAFIVTKTGTFASVDRTDRKEPRGNLPVVYEETNNLAIGAKQTRLLQIRFAVAPDDPLDITDGLLVIKLVPTKPARVALVTLVTKGQLETAPARGSETPQPTSSSMVVTSVVPFGHWWLWGEHQQVLLPAKRDEAVGRKYVVFLGSDSGGRLRATLRVKRDDEGTSNEMTPARIVVDHVGRVDKYSGNLVLGPGESEKIAMTVHVRDFFLWPFLALLAGAVLGGWGIHSWEQQRRRALLDKRVKEAYGAYEAATKIRPPNDRPPPLDPDPETRMNSLMTAIKQAESDDDYNAQVDAVAAYEVELRRWLRLATAADGLTKLEHELSPEAEAAREDVRDVLAWLEDAPDDAEEGDGLAGQAERLAEIVDMYIPIWRMWEAKGQPSERELNPGTTYRRSAFKSKAKSLKLRRELEDLRSRLRSYEPPRAEDAFNFALLRGAIEIHKVPVELASRLMFWRSYDGLTPSAIEHRVRMYDWAVGGAALIVTLLAFLLTKYGQEYGTLSDYAEAFTAGFLGQVAGATIAWNLLPPFRSYRATKTQAAAQPAAG